MSETVLNDTRAKLRAIVSSRRGVLVAGAFNALSARVIEDAGFQAVYVTGAGLANGHLGLPDVGLLSLTEIADHVARIRNVCGLPLIVDADTGFGNPVNVWHTVRVLEAAGADAIQIEDQQFPKRCGHFSGKSVIAVDEMEQKIASAVGACRHKTLIIARTDAYASEGLEGAISRAKRYCAAGADMTFVEAPKRPEDLDRIIDEVDAPQLINLVIGGKTPPIARDRLEAMGAGLVLYANAALQGALLGMQSALNQLRATGILAGDEGVTASFSERQRLVGFAEIEAMGREFAVPSRT